MFGQRVDEPELLSIFEGRGPGWRRKPIFDLYVSSSLGSRGRNTVRSFSESNSRVGQTQKTPWEPTQDLPGFLGLEPGLLAVSTIVGRSNYGNDAGNVAIIVKKEFRVKTFFHHHHQRQGGISEIGRTDPLSNCICHNWIPFVIQPFDNVRMGSPLDSTCPWAG
jgi:hypothetical protein